MSDINWTSRTTYTRNGSQTDYVIGMPYISQSDIKVYINSSTTPLTLGVDYTFFGSDSIRFATGGVNGDQATFRRETDRSILETLQYGNTPSTSEINNILKRVQYIVQEAADSALEGALNQIVNGAYDAHSQKIVNLASGTTSTDAINLGQLNSAVATINTSLAGKQPLDATLSGLAALVGAADQLIYGTGVDTFNTTAFTAFARTLVDDVDATTAQATLGLGALAVLNTVNNALWSGTQLSIANGGTGQTTANGALNALLPTQATNGGKTLQTDGTNTSWQPTVINNGNWSGTQLSIANGGTGQTTANAALNALLPTQTSNSGKVLQTDGTNASWQTLAGTGTVTSIDASRGVRTASGSPITGSGTIYGNIPVSARSTNTMLAAADRGALIVATSTYTQTLDAAATLGSGWYVNIRNDGTGVITIDPNASETIDGATTLAVNPGESFIITCDGTSFKTIGRATGIAATQADQEAATGTNKYVAPGTQQYHPSAAKAWVNFNGTGTIAIRASYNVTSLTDNATGDWTVNFTTPFSSANFCGIPNGGKGANAGTGGITVGPSVANPTASAFRINSVTTAGAAVDLDYINAAFYGDQ